MMRRFALLMLATGGLLFTLAASAAEQAGAKVDLAKAQQIVGQVCAACHGADGNSIIPTSPSLAGQPARYIVTQLQNFKSGVRASPVMAGMAAMLTTNDDVNAVAAYFAQQPPRGSEAKNRQLAEQGQKIFRGGKSERAIPACSACHAPDGAGMAAHYPRLAGQSADYVYGELKKFKEGARGNNEKDAGGRVMAAIAAKLADQEMRALAEYAAGLQ